MADGSPQTLTLNGVEVQDDWFGVVGMQARVAHNGHAPMQLLVDRHKDEWLLEQVHTLRAMGCVLDDALSSMRFLFDFV